MRYKFDELAAGFYDSDVNAAGLHFFKGKPLIDKSNVLKFLKRMPKGANLHMHNSASVSSDWMVRNISYMPGLLRCTNKEGISILSFRRTPREHGCVTQYVLVNEERFRSISPAVYDRSFEKLINLYTPKPDCEYKICYKYFIIRYFMSSKDLLYFKNSLCIADYPTIKHVWRKFQNMFSTTGDLLSYIPAFRAYTRRMLEEMYEDNLMYAEVRMSFKEVGKCASICMDVKGLLNIFLYLPALRLQWSAFPARSHCE